MSSPGAAGSFPGDFRQLEALAATSQTTPSFQTQAGATLGQGWAAEDGETSQLGSLSTRNMLPHKLWTQTPPLGVPGGHWEVIFFCLRLSKRRPPGQLSSSPDLEAGKGSEARQGLQPAGRVGCLAWGGSLLFCLPVYRLPETPTVGF